MKFDRPLHGRYPFSLNNLAGTDIFVPLGFGGLSFVNGVRMILHQYPLIMSENNAAGEWTHIATTYEGSVKQGNSSTNGGVVILFITLSVDH